MRKSALPGVTIAVLTLILVGCGSSRETKTTSYTPQDLKAFVEKACDYVKTNGKEAALKEFTKTSGPFQKGELYIFAYNTDGTVIAHGGDPTLVGKNIITYRDPNGVPAVKEAADIAGTKGGGWLLCMFPNPKTKKQQDKLVYVKKVDDNWFIGSGLYL